MWPFETWRDIEETRWVTVEIVGNFLRQRLAKKQVRMSDGATRWKVKGYFPFGPIEQIVERDS